MSHDTPAHLSLTLAQARALAGLTERAEEGWLFGSGRLTADLLETLDLYLWQSGCRTLALVEPAGAWFEISPSGEIGDAGPASRAERLTVGFHCSRLWARRRSELAALGQSADETIVAEATDEDDEHEQATIVLVTADDRVVEWRSRTEGGRLIDLTADWRDGLAWKAAVSDAIAARGRLFPPPPTPGTCS